MKKTGSLYVMVLLLFVVLLSACNYGEASSENGQSSVIKLTVADSLSLSNDLSAQGMVYWMNRVEELSEGRIEFVHYPAEQLGKAKNLLDYAKTGVVDVAYIGVGYVPEKMPLSGVGELPGSASSSKEATEAYWELIDGVLYDAEYKKYNIQPLFAVILPPYKVMTKGEKVVSVEDLNGLKLRSGGGTQSFVLNQLGATPVSMSAPDTYTALERGTIDGVIFPSTSVKPYQLETIIDYITGNSHLGGFVASYVINQDTLESLPPNLQEIIIQAGHETRLHLSAYLDQLDAELEQTFKDAGVEYVEFDEASVESINETIESAWTNWGEQMDNRGLNGTEVVETFKRNLGQ